MPRARGAIYQGFKLLELLRQHIPHDFDPRDFLIAGSARHWAGGIISQLSDLDILVRPASETWNRACDLAFLHGPIFDSAPLRTSALTGTKIACLYGGVVEVCDTWLLDEYDTATLIEHADVIGGLKYLPVPEVVAYKQKLDRPKDRLDLAAVELHTSEEHGAFVSRRRR